MPWNCPCIANLWLRPVDVKEVNTRSRYLWGLWQRTGVLSPILLSIKMYPSKKLKNIKCKWDHRSYRRNFCSCEKKAWKIQACTGFEPLTSAMPVQRSNQLSWQANWELVIIGFHPKFWIFLGIMGPIHGFGPHSHDHMSAVCHARDERVTKACACLHPAEMFSETNSPSRSISSVSLVYFI